MAAVNLPEQFEELRHFTNQLFACHNAASAADLDAARSAWVYLEGQLCSSGLPTTGPLVPCPLDQHAATRHAPVAQSNAEAAAALCSVSLPENTTVDPPADPAAMIAQVEDLLPALRSAAAAQHLSTSLATQLHTKLSALGLTHPPERSRSGRAASGSSAHPHDPPNRISGGARTFQPPVSGTPPSPPKRHPPTGARQPLSIHNSTLNTHPAPPPPADRKRDSNGNLKSAPPPAPAPPPASQWPSSRRPPPLVSSTHHHPHHHAAAPHPYAPGGAAPGGPDVIDVDSGGEDDPHGARLGAPPGMGFQSAKVKLAADMRKKGQNYNAMFGSNQAAPRTGLTRRGGGRGMGGGGGGAGGPGACAGGRGAFVPPFVQKAVDSMGGGQGGEGESLYSEKTMQLLAGPDGELPPELGKVDPKMVEMVCNEIVDSGCSVQWDDIAGQANVKRLVQEMVVWPILNPHLFQGARAPPKGLLLFGPPGTGKTLIGKAIASNISATFFSISASSLTSKWIGEGEKMVRALFAVAGCLQPAVIFIDEIDSILSARKAEGEHEASRRMKTEMLIQMEGCDPASAARRVLLIGATNRPEELDEAARRRLPKQLYIPLPCGEARQQMVLRQLGPGAAVRADLSSEDLAKLARRTEGYSGSDMRALIQEACQGPVRDAVARHGAAVTDLSESDLRAVVLKDFQVAAKAQKASVSREEVLRYEQYNDKHGARYYDENDGAAEEDEEW